MAVLLCTAPRSQALKTSALRRVMWVGYAGARDFILSYRITKRPMIVTFRLLLESLIRLRSTAHE